LNLLMTSRTRSELVNVTLGDSRHIQALDRQQDHLGSPPRDHPDERRTTHDQSVPLVIGNLPHPQIPCVLHDTPTLPIRPVTNVIEMVLDQPIQVVDLHGKRC
jgi:hypothetical protein